MRIAKRRFAGEENAVGDPRRRRADASYYYLLRGMIAFRDSTDAHERGTHRTSMSPRPGAGCSGLAARYTGRLSELTDPGASGFRAAPGAARQYAAHVHVSPTEVRKRPDRDGTRARRQRNDARVSPALAALAESAGRACG
eukprot:CAMPEP_0185175752 /NCGR_PEP_ID=MMETSP1139-20130426/27273_1 /TAXON_ID=298111 /ORGANISM="Pavlova sp., Strain CCMP459" /LENGTH=140 /DNA_ID=CAMNT_0027741493 /DNA_START=528 /DNA_END=949 /DNA_ORIENTATION=+